MSSSVPTPGAASEDSPRGSLFQRGSWLASRLLVIALFLIAGAGFVFAVGIAQRWGWIRSADGVASASDASGAIHTCPMHPQIRQPGEGRCPICGMALVPAAGAGTGVDDFSVRIEPAQRRLANIETAEVESGVLEDSLETIGAIAMDESRQATIAAYVAGRIERLFADYEGVEIRQGDHLAVLYSPELYAAQVEYLEARRALDVAAGLPAVRRAQESLTANTRQRLREFGMTQEQLEQLEAEGQAQSRLTIHAPQGGTVIEKLVVEGSYVKAGDPIYRIAELSTVWLMLRLFPEDATRIRFGQRVEAVVQSQPGQRRVGRVAFIGPTVDPETRTVAVRVELLNENGQLRPGDYATARIRLPIGPLGDVYDQDLAGKWISPMHPQIIEDQPGQCPICGMDLVPTSQYGFAGQPVPQAVSVHVPRSAVLLAGNHSVVYVETEPGRFEIRPVTLGPILRDRIVILDGLQVGEVVATAGNFLIDSQMQLAGKPSLIDPARAIAKTQERAGPLQFDQIAVASLGGEAGAKLEELYAAYFEIQRSLAGDEKPAPDAARSLYQAATALAAEPGLAEDAQRLVDEIATESEHLHHVDLEGARQAFKPISHAVVTLATQARSEAAAESFIHFFCPMVPGGGGDWLQSNDDLLNPYFGSEMLRCGERVRELPSQGELPTPDDSHTHDPSHTHDASSAESGGA